MTKLLSRGRTEGMPGLRNSPPDFMQGPGQKEPPRGSDPWSDETWGENAVNVTFETVETDVFEFSTEGSSIQNGNSPEDVEFSLYRGGSAVASREMRQQEQQRKPAGPPLVTVAVHEQLSATYDDVSEEPSCHLEGSVYVRATADMSRHPFCLVVRDLLGHVEVLEDRTVVSKDVSQQISRKGLHRADRVVRISLPSSSTRKDVQIARYICTTRLRPVPLVSPASAVTQHCLLRLPHCFIHISNVSFLLIQLVKSRVQSSGQHSRVGFKIRANPTNQASLKRIVIMLAIPPHVNGRSGKLSRKGGLWDELKRTVSWTIEEMPPGQALEIQAQFEILDGESASNLTLSPKFPILVRCEYESLFSSVEIKNDYHDSLCKPIQMELKNTARVLHRKV